MRLTKRILKSSSTQATIAFLLAQYIRLVMLTSRITRDIHPDSIPYIVTAERNAIIAFWHGRLMLMPAFSPARKMHVLSSGHSDGLLISRIISHFGFATVEGSSSKGGGRAVAEILRILKKGNNIAITPDGPRGPFQIAADGVTVIARASGKPIIPVAFSTSRYKRFSSWDRFILALPFGHIQFHAGAPIWISRQDDPEEVRLRFEQAMNRLVEQADDKIKLNSN